MTTINTLAQFGLTDKEARVYLAALALGTAPLVQIARKAGVKLSTTHLTIATLLQRHLLVAVPKGKKTLYQAADPQLLGQTLDQQRQQFLQTLPELQNLYVQNLKRPRVRFYEGKPQLVKLYEEMFRTKELRGMFSYDGHQRVLGERELRHFFRILVRQNGVIYDLVEQNRAAQQYLAWPHRRGASQVKLLPKGMKIDTDLLISNGKVSLVSFENVLGVIIEDRAIANTLEATHRLIWNCLTDPAQ